MGHSKSISKREVYCNITLPQKNKKDLKWSNVTTKGTRRRRQAKPKVSRKKERMKIRAEINEIQTEKTCTRSMKQSWFFGKTNKIDKL